MARSISLLLTVALSLTATATRAGDVLVAVAANFTGTSQRLAADFEQRTGHRTRLSFGSTGKLYAQIDQGAPYDVFLAADHQRPERAEAQGLAVAGSRFTYALGKLVLWSPVPELTTDGERYLASASSAALAIANPRTAPYGTAARQVLEHLQLWSTQQARLVRGDSIAQTFQFVATGNAEAGFVALSQVRNWSGPGGSVWDIPADYYHPIRQQAVLLTRGIDNPAASAWLAYLRSEPARRLIRQHGYGTD